MPGGCNFGGVRPIDQHVKGFTALGGKMMVEGGFILAKAEGGRLHGANIYLDVVSVGATMNIMMAAVLADGNTVIENAAKEPHIVDLANFLNSMGANIRGAGTDTIKIRGVEKLTGGSYAIIPDQIEAGTYMAAVAATGGQVLVKNIIPKHMDCITAKLQECGVEVEEQDDTLLVRRIIVGDPDAEDESEVFALRPMTCPFQFMAYLNRSRSYRDLPLRYNETSTLFRKESSGEMHGLIRLRQFTISEGHLACRPDQVAEEFHGCLDLAKFMLETLGLAESVTYRFSKWDENNRDKYIGEKESWESTQDMMRQILTDLGLDFVEADGEAAFYGPKLDIQIKNVHGKEDTLITIQIDFQLAERFGIFLDQGSTLIPLHWQVNS